MCSGTRRWRRSTRRRCDCLPRCCASSCVVRRDEAAFDDTREYAFQHHLLHQVTYDSVLKAPKRDRPCPRRRVLERARRGRPARSRWTRPTAVRWPRRSTTAASPTRRPMSPGSMPQFTHYLDAYAAQTLRPLAEQLVDVCERQFGPDHPETAKALTNLARVAADAGQRASRPSRCCAARIAIQETALCRPTTPTPRADPGRAGRLPLGARRPARRPSPASGGRSRSASGCWARNIR